MRPRVIPTYSSEMEGGDAAPVQVLVDEEFQHGGLGHAGRQDDGRLALLGAAPGGSGPRPRRRRRSASCSFEAQRSTRIPDLYPEPRKSTIRRHEGIAPLRQAARRQGEVQRLRRALHHPRGRPRRLPHPAQRKGTLYTLLYGLTSSVCIDPIEKKPLYHFYPGSRILSMGTRGCNFRCPGCQNWEISHDSPDQFGENMERLDPAESARLAQRRGCHGIGWTYNDPTIWLEHTLEAMIEAKKLGLYSAFMTNGYATEEQMEMIGPYLTAWRGRPQGLLARVVQEGHRPRPVGRRSSR